MTISTIYQSISTLAGWQLLNATPESKRVAAENPTPKTEPGISSTAALTATQLATEQFTKAVSKLSSVSDLFNHPQIISYLETAYGVPADSTYNGLVKAVLTSDVNDVNSLASRIQNPGLQEMAVEIDLHKDGLTNLQNTTLQQAIIKGYQTQSYEDELGQLNPALQNMEYFQRKIGTMTNIYELMGDSTILQMLNIAGGLPAQEVNKSLNDRVADYEKVFNVKDVQNHAYITKFLDRYAVNADADGSGSPASSQSTNYLTTLFSNTQSNDIISLDLSSINLTA